MSSAPQSSPAASQPKQPSPVRRSRSQSQPESQTMAQLPPQTEQTEPTEQQSAQSAVFLERILGFIGRSRNVMSSLYTRIMGNEQTKTLVLNILKSVATAYIVKKTTAQVPQPVIDQTKAILNNHTYSGSSLRKLLTNLLMTIVVSAGITGVYISRKEIKRRIDGLVNKMNLKSVMEVLSSIVVAVVEGLKTIHTRAAESFRNLLKKTEVGAVDPHEPPDDEVLAGLLEEDGR